MHASRSSLLFLKLAFQSNILLQLLVLERKLADARLMELVIMIGGSDRLCSATLQVWIPTAAKSRFTTPVGLSLRKSALRSRLLIKVMIVVRQSRSAHPEGTLIRQLRLARLLTLLLGDCVAWLYTHPGFEMRF